MILALTARVMKRWWLISAVGAVSALVVLQLTQKDAPSAPLPPDWSGGAAEAQPLPAVQVEQVLVRAELVQPRRASGASESPVSDPPSAVPWTPASSADVAHSSWTDQDRTAFRTAAADLGPPRPSSATPPPLFERAKRAFLGDGRHVPQPFPRVKDN